MLSPFTIAIAGDRIVTMRFEEFRAFRQFLLRAGKGGNCTTPSAIFLGLLEAIVDRTADVLEHISGDVDKINQEIFVRRRKEGRHKGQRLEVLISAIGLQGDVAAKARESLASIERLIQYAGVALPGSFAKGSNRARMKLIARDVRSLEDYVSFLSNKITFLLDATLGLISVEQNEVIRILTVAATVLFPPTLIGTIYGMNFKDMPELTWPYGYPAAILLMVASAIIPYVFFKRRGWL
jgi:magnesium transporter